MTIRRSTQDFPAMVPTKLFGLVLPDWLGGKEVFNRAMRFSYGRVKTHKWNFGLESMMNGCLVISGPNLTTNKWEQCLYNVYGAIWVTQSVFPSNKDKFYWTTSIYYKEYKITKATKKAMSLSEGLMLEYGNRV